MTTVTEERTLYRCENPACSLGAVGEPGHFTGGITPHGINVLTGRPVESLEDHEHGDGVCPNCGKPGVALDEPHLVIAGEDPYQEIHDNVAARVADPKNRLTAETAQDAVEQLIVPEAALTPTTVTEEVATDEG